ncbi:MAG: heavy metal-binding domain-containing protein [Firmicutes bacterium]|nr:heavy metal-binding domain-containing protein [Bacillota bacterium]
MPWFRKNKDAGNPPAGGSSSRAIQHTFRQYTAETEQQMIQDREALEAGRLPDGAVKRVQRTVARELPWMSTLAIPDLYLADELRMTPLVQVAGSCFYNAASDMNGRIYLDSNYDAANLVYAYYRAKREAVERMLMEARMAEAHAVVDAQFRFSRQQSLVECTVIGTAVRFEGLRPPKVPLVSPLSGEEFYKLWQIGWMPVNYCLGYHWHCMPVGYSTRAIVSSWNFYNQELTSVTTRFSDTRRYAVEKMVQDAQGGPRVDGFVGVQVTTAIEETELTIFAGYQGGFGGFGMMGNGITIDGTFYPFGPEGSVEVPAYNLEFFATGAGVARLQPGRLTPGDIGTYLAALE